MSNEYKELLFLLNAMSSPLGTPLLSKMFTLMNTSEPARPIMESITLEPGEEHVMIEGHEEIGILRVGLFSTDNPALRILIDYAPMPNYMINVDTSVSDLMFIGLDKTGAKFPYLVKAEQTTNPYTGIVEWVYTASHAPAEGSLFYNGWIGNKLQNPIYNPSPIHIYWVITERWILKDKYYAVLKELTE